MPARARYHRVQVRQQALSRGPRRRSSAASPEDRCTPTQVRGGRGIRRSDDRAAGSAPSPGRSAAGGPASLNPRSATAAPTLATGGGNSRGCRCTPATSAAIASASVIGKAMPLSRYRSPAIPRSAASRCPVTQSSMSTRLMFVGTNTFSRPSRNASRNRAVPPLRPGPCTEEGLTQTRSCPSSRAALSAARSPSVLVRSYVERYDPRWGVASVPIVPVASPIVAADDVWIEPRRRPHATRPAPRLPGRRRSAAPSRSDPRRTTN